jgi:hypothetical protein
MVPTSSTPTSRAVQEILERRGEPLFALLDAARDPSVLPLLMRSAEPYESLYDEPDAGRLVAVAPYLVSLAPGSKLLHGVVARGWGQAWAVFLRSARSLPQLRAHLRQFLIVRSEAGKQMLFRFYDPRVLRAFLPLATPRQSSQLFSEVSAFLVEGVEGAERAELLSFTLGATGAVECAVVC